MKITRKKRNNKEKKVIIAVTLFIAICVLFIVGVMVLTSFPPLGASKMSISNTNGYKMLHTGTILVSPIFGISGSSTLLIEVANTTPFLNFNNSAIYWSLFYANGGNIYAFVSKGNVSSIGGNSPQTLCVYQVYSFTEIRNNTFGNESLLNAVYSTAVINRDNSISIDNWKYCGGT